MVTKKGKVVDIHNPMYQNFVVHQLSVGQAEALWQLFESVQNKSIPAIEVVHDLNGALQALGALEDLSERRKPISAQELREFELFIKGQERLT